MKNIIENLVNVGPMRFNPFRQFSTTVSKILLSGRISANLIVSASIAFGVFVPTQAKADYSIISIADITRPFALLGPAAINASGRAASAGTLDAGGAGIYSGSGGAMVTIAVPNSPFRQIIPEMIVLAQQDVNGPSVGTPRAICMIAPCKLS